MDMEKETVAHDTHGTAVSENPSMKPKTRRPRKPSLPPKPPKDEKDKFDAKAYHKRYYREKLKGECRCKYCDKVLGSVQSITKHEAKNLQCKIKRLQHMLNESSINE